MRKPVPHPSPNKAHACVRCGFYINPRWTSNDETIGHFYDRLERAVKGRADEPPDSFVWFRRQCEERERRGRTKFGHEYLRRDNALEATEEAADLGNYMFFDALQHIRQGEPGQDIDCELMAAYHAYKAWTFAVEARAKRGGYTGAALPE